MKKWEKRLLAILTVLAMLAVSCFASAAAPAAGAAPAQGVCQGNREGTVNGLPACVNEAGDLHVCANNFPDDNFRAYLLESLAAIYEGLGVPYTDYFTAYVLSNVTSLTAPDRDIASLEGVEYFAQLDGLICSGNRLTELDVSHNPALRLLTCSGNQLTELDLSHNPALRDLSCSENRLTELDVSGNPLLEKLLCPVNQISELDLSGNPNLQLLYCYRNRLRALNLEGNPLLTAENAMIMNQTAAGLYTADGSGWVLDMADLVSAENLDRVLSVSDGEYTPATGMVTLSHLPAQLTYDYDTGVEGLSLSVTVTPAEEEGGHGNGDGVFAGLPACVNENGALHICEENFPDENFRAYLLEQPSGEDGYISQDEADGFLSMMISNQGIRSLVGVGYFTNLQTLSCSFNELTELDMSHNPNLRSLSCGSNQLTVLNVSQNTELRSLTCEANQISELDVSGSPNLQLLYCYRNRLRALNLEGNPLLTTKNAIIVNQETEAAYTAAGNQWVLDMADLVSAENLGRVLSVSDGEYDVVAGTVTLSYQPAKLTYTYSTGVEGLTLSVTVASSNEDAGHEGVDGAFAGLPACVNGEGALHICAKNFPDENFRAYLLEQPLGTDGYISQYEADKFTGLMVSGQGIRSLAGIAYFTNLQVLSCSSNQLTQLDVSHNPKLRSLSCGSNQLTSLDVSQNTELQSLTCEANQISELDLSKNPNLQNLYCYRNRLYTLDLSGNLQLTAENCMMDQEVQAVYTAAGDGWVLDIAALVSAENLGRVLSVSMGSYDPASGRVTLNGATPPSYLNYRYDTGLSELLLSVTITPAPVTGGQEEIDGAFAGLPACVNTNGDLHICEKNFPDENFRAYLLEQEGGEDGYFTAAEAGAFTGFSVDDRGIASLAGLGYFPGLTELSCEDNALTELDLSDNTALTRLYCGGNQLTALNVSWCPALVTLYCEENRLTSLDISGNTSLEFLNCGGNRLSSLDAGGLAALEYLSCRDNQLTALNIKGAAALTDLDCSDNQLAELDVSSNTLLESLDCINNRLTALDVSANPALREFDCRSNQLRTLDVSQNPQLELFICGNNRLAYLDLRGNPALTTSATLLTQTISAEAKPAAVGWEVDLSAFIPEEWLGQVLSVTAGTYDPATGVVAFAEEPDSFAYTIATGFEGLDMTVNVSLKGDILPGDLDGSGTVDIGDVMAACRILARKNTGSRPTTDEIARGDLTGDGDVQIDDIMAICKLVAQANM